METVEGVETEPSDDQPTVDVEPSQSFTMTTTASPTSGGSSVSSTGSSTSTSATATSLAIYPDDVTDTTTNNAFQDSLYRLDSAADVYASEDDVGVFFWLANLTNVQQQNLSDYGVS